jgi:hypothetical protein
MRADGTIMRNASIVFAALFVSLLLALSGCIPGLQMTKPTADSPSPDTTKEAPAKTPTDTARQPDKKADAQVPPPPDYKPPALSEALLEGPADLSWKDEISASALEFAKNIPNVKHTKICFSKLYGGEGGWYLLLYVEKAKKMRLEQYSWNPKFKEWEPSFQLKEIPAKDVELHLKGEVQDEKCFILKHAN